MQFTEKIPIMQFTEKIPQFLPMNNKNQVLTTRARPWPSFPTPKPSGTASFGDANCMEQLLVHCATAIESNDATMAQQILWVLHNLAPPDGDSSQRLTSAFLRALISRVARSGNSKLLTAMANAGDLTTIFSHKFSIIELASFVDLTPWHRFGFTAANTAVIDAIDKYSVVHIVDLSLTHCMQIPTLIDSIASRAPEGPPLIKLTVAGSTEDYPPMLDLSYDELGLKLVNFARSRNVVMEFRVIPSSSSNGFSSLIDHLRLQQFVRRDSNEALVVNCHMMLHYLPQDTLISTNNNNSLRTMFIKSLRSLNPTMVVLVDEDADFTSNDLVNRLRSAYNYLWIPYDTVDTLLPKGSKQRQWFEANICWKIDNVISYEGPQRVERLEPKSKWVQRMRNAGFAGVAFGEEGMNEVKSMLDEHAAGWGLKKEEGDHVVLTWKGHNAVFATAWVPV